jgi:cysteine-S-conjugate beta-lyase
MLVRYGVEVSYLDPLIGAAIESLFKPNTKAVLVEASGSQSIEISDIPAIAEVAHARGALVIDDNTWATPLFHRSLDQGVDISIQAATKYIWRAGLLPRPTGPCGRSLSARRRLRTFADRPLTTRSPCR